MELDKRCLFYGFNHKNATQNRLKKGTKNPHKRVETILKASTDPNSRNIDEVESKLFQAYLYDPNSFDPDVKKWEFFLGTKSKPLISLQHNFNTDNPDNFNSKQKVKRSGRV
jgi:hypothetical protein